MLRTWQAEFVCLSHTSSEEVTLGKENGLLRFASACALPLLPSSATRAFSLLFRVPSTAGRRFSQENSVAKAGVTRR